MSELIEFDQYHNGEVFNSVFINRDKILSVLEMGSMCKVVLSDKVFYEVTTSELIEAKIIPEPRVKTNKGK